MSKNNQNEKTNESLKNSQKGYSLRERTSFKGNPNYIKLNLDGENESYDSSMLKKKRNKEEYTSNCYECSFDGCRKKFYEKSAFHKHQLTHGDKLFICNNCGKKFLDNSKLRRHSLVHTGEKPFKCDICNKRFSLDFNLRTHLRIHTGEKPYACTYPGCFKRFSQSSNLSAHEKTHELAKDNSIGNFGYNPSSNEFQLFPGQQRPIFPRNPLKYLIYNQYSGTMTLNNLLEINKLYELMKEGISLQLSFSNNMGNQSNLNPYNTIGSSMRVNSSMKFYNQQGNNQKDFLSSYYGNNIFNNNNHSFIRSDAKIPSFPYNNIILDNSVKKLSDGSITYESFQTISEKPNQGPKKFIFEVHTDYNNNLPNRNFDNNINNNTVNNEILVHNGNIHEITINGQQEKPKKIFEIKKNSNLQGQYYNEVIDQYNQGIQGDELYYLNQYNQQYNQGPANQQQVNYYEEERNATDNDEADGYFDRIGWEN